MKNVLMCRPTYFQVEYKINPWMEIGAVDQKKAMDQWKNLVSKYTHLGLKVWIIDQEKEQPDMVFSADQGIVNNGKILLSNFKFKERKGESLIYENWFENFGLKILKLPDDIYFEGGGETIKWNGKLFVGTGFRTSSEALKPIEAAINLETIGLELIDSRFYHLDTCFFVLNEKVAFYYAPAFSKKSIEIIKSHIPETIELTENDVTQFAANCVVINKSVIIQKENDHLAKLVKSFSYTPIIVDLSEFNKSGGGAHCLTGELG